MSSIGRLAITVAVVGCGALNAECQNGMTTVFFANGISTTWKQSYDTTYKVLEPAVLTRLAQTSSSVNQSCLTFAPAYDSSFVDVNNALINGSEVIAQILTAIGQRSLDVVSNFWPYLEHLVPVISVPDWFVQAWETGVSAAISVNSPDLLTQEGWYITAGQGNDTAIVVAHSQGNLYVNEVYPIVSLLASVKPIAIASPAPHTVGSGPWFTLTNDIILLVPGALKADKTNVPGCGSSLSEQWNCHDFDYSYMSGNNGQTGVNANGNFSGPAIEDAVISAIPATSNGTLPLYQFSFTPSGGQMKPVTFSFSSPTFVGSGALAFTPFTISDGTNTWTMTSGFAFQTVGPDGVPAYCFNFGTPGAPDSNACGYGVGSPGMGAIVFQFVGNLPTSYGVYDTGGFPSYDPFAVAAGNPVGNLGQTISGSFGTGVLTISSTNPSQVPPTAGFTMSGFSPPPVTVTKIDGSTLTVYSSAGSTASVAFDATTRSSAASGATITDWQWTINGSVVATTPTFTRLLPASATIGQTITYQISLVVTDSRGFQSQPAQGTIIVGNCVSVCEVNPGIAHE